MKKKTKLFKPTPLPETAMQFKDLATVKAAMNTALEELYRPGGSGERITVIHDHVRVLISKGEFPADFHVFVRRQGEQ